jgi:hypothetical protein
MKKPGVKKSRETVPLESSEINFFRLRRNSPRKKLGKNILLSDIPLQSLIQNAH